MFILRRISSAGVEMNHSLGDGYTYINREYNVLEFRRSFKVFFDKDHVADLDETSDEDSKDVYGFIGNGPFLQPLYKNQKNFIMTESGKTFSNLSYK
jgi:hypothetical protein